MNQMKLQLAGFGLVFYSPTSAKHIKPGEDYFASHFEDPTNAAQQAVEGKIFAINLGSPGNFIINFRENYPAPEMVEKSDYTLRAGIEILDEVLCVRDIFDLIRWSPDCPKSQMVQVPNGFYHMTFLTSIPKSGVTGDDQMIDLYMHPLPKMPQLKYSGVPCLF